jgi:glucose/arabinose dehydrogenase
MARTSIRQIARALALTVGLPVGLPVLLLLSLLWLPAQAQGNLALVKVADELAAPVFITHAGDGSGRLFIVEQGGTIRILRNGAVLPTPFLDISDRVAFDGEAGLLSIAFPPNYAEDGYFFVYYNHDGELAGPEPIDAGNNGGYDIVVARFRVSDNPDVADPDSEQRILIRSKPYKNHNGGMMTFGPDGYLYLGLGDGGSSGDPQNQAQNLGTWLGKILRIEVGPTGTYTVPAGNPFVDTANAKPEIWHYGLRNPWRWSFDRATDDLWIADVGQGAFEEIDFAAAGQSGLNFGWRCKEGFAEFNDNPPCVGSLTDPIAVYGRSLGRSVTGGYVYRGDASPTLQGHYVYADFASGRIWSLRNVNGEWSEPAQELDTELAISSFGEDEGGELYVVDYGGSIYRLIGAAFEATDFLYLPVATTPE